MLCSILTLIYKKYRLTYCFQSHIIYLYYVFVKPVLGSKPPTIREVQKPRTLFIAKKITFETEHMFSKGGASCQQKNGISLPKMQMAITEKTCYFAGKNMLCAPKHSRDSIQSWRRKKQMLKDTVTCAFQLVFLYFKQKIILLYRQVFICEILVLIVQS